MGENKNIRLLKWFNFFTDLKLYGPIAVIYFSQITESFALAMSIFSLVFLFSALFELPTGLISDYIGRKNTLIMGVVCAIIFTVLYAVGISYWILVLGALFEGISRAFYSGNNEAIIYDSLSENEKDDFALHFGKTSSMFQVALAFSAIAGSVMANFSFSLVIWLSVLPQLICLFLGFKLKQVRYQKVADTDIFSHLKEAIKLIKSNIRLRRLSLAMMINRGVSESAFDFQAAFYYTVWPLWAIGIAKMLSYAGAAFSFHYASVIINKFGELKTILFRHITNRIVFSIALLFPNVLSPLFLTSGSMLYGAEVTATHSLAQKEYNDRQRATLGSIVNFGGSLIFSFFAVLLGVLADKYGPAKALFTGQLVLLIVIWIYVSIYNLPDKNKI